MSMFGIPCSFLCQINYTNKIKRIFLIGRQFLKIIWGNNFWLIGIFSLNEFWKPPLCNVFVAFERLKAVDCFRKAFHHRYLAGFSIRLCHPFRKVSFHKTNFSTEVKFYKFSSLRKKILRSNLQYTFWLCKNSLVQQVFTWDFIYFNHY